MNLLFGNLTVTCPAPALQMPLFFFALFVGVQGHAVVAAEVKKANEIDAVIGYVALMGVAAERKEGRNPQTWGKASHFRRGG